MLLDQPLLISQTLLTALGTQISIHNREFVPAGPVLVISNHRSFMDPLLLMVAAQRSIRFACHHYMNHVPLLRDVVEHLGCLPLAAPQQGQQAFFQRAEGLLRSQQSVGIFPEGAAAMIAPHPADQVGSFNRGFAHLALRSQVEQLQILPVAIAARAETSQPMFPLKCLSLFAPSEPLFHQDGWHPLVVYQQVDLLIGQPWSIASILDSRSQTRLSPTLVADVTNRCQQQVQSLLRQGSYV